MKFYVTIEGINRLKKSFLNLKIFHIIDVNSILTEHHYSIDTIDEYGTFIVSSNIENLIKTYSKSKRIRGIIYSNPYLTIDSLSNLFNTVYSNPNISEIVLLEDYNVPKLKHLHHEFDEILFFPSLKKVRLMECIPIKMMDTN